MNDCHADTFYLAGTTTGIKNQIYVHRDSKDVDVFVVFSDMKNHYFAGYSNAIKNFMPGICNYQSTEKNHALALDDHSTFGYHPLHPDPERRYNPLAIDMQEAYQMITDGRPAYVVATISKKENILWCDAGLLEEVIVKGIKEVDRMMSMKVKKADKLIVSCGGYPNDESLYTAQRALELSKNGVKDNGEILFFAGCADGLGPEKSVKNFFEPLQADIETILSKLHDKYIMYAHKTYKFARLINRMKRISLVSELPGEIVERIHLFPETQPQALIDKWLKENPSTSIGIITDGNKLALHGET
jgi:nickel-dependent lactate racemase